MDAIEELHDSYSEDKEAEYVRIETKYNPENFPKYILISGHGRVINCDEKWYGEECFTLLPRDYKLILSTATGQSLAKVYDKQVNATYYRMYEGLIPNHTIDFNLTLKGSAEQPGVNLKSIKEIKGENYFLHFEPRGVVVPVGLMERINKKRGNPSLEKITEYAKYFTVNLLELSQYDNPQATYSILPIEKIEEQIVNRVTREYKGDFHHFKLSQLLKHIEEVGKTNGNVPKVILGYFCRSGDFNYNIDGLINHCKKFGLKPLMKEYFMGDISYEGVSPELRRGVSLASKTKPQDFWGIYDNIASNLSMFEALTRGKFETVRKKNRSI
jgi:hypothetical protein